MDKIKVVIVDDSLFFRESIQQRLHQDINICVAGKTGNPYLARDMIVEHLPDVLIVDINLEKMNAVQFLEQILPQYDVPVIALSSGDAGRNSGLGKYIVDFIRKPSSVTGEAGQTFFAELLVAIRKAVFQEENPYSPAMLASTVVAVGASTGGADAIEELVSTMPVIMPPIVISQHMSAGFTESFARRLNRKYGLSAKEARDGDLLIPGQIYIAPGSRDMMVQNRRGRYYLRVLPPAADKIAHPNINVLFHSIAESGSENAVGILLTGMGKDGACGLQAMREAGYITIGQDRQTSVIYGMPRVAMELGAVSYQLPLGQITRKCMEQLAVFERKIIS